MYSDVFDCYPSVKRTFMKAYYKKWTEELHPRGQPENAGQFAESAGASPSDYADAGAKWDDPDAPVSGAGLLSPNEGPPMEFAKAKALSRGGDMAGWAIQMADIGRQAGIETKVRPAIGDWAPGGEGAEQAAEVVLSQARDYDQIKYALAHRGWQSNQFAVIPFVEDHSGPDTMWEIEINKPQEQVRPILDKYGIGSRTLVDMGRGRTKVVLFDPGTQIEESVQNVAREFGVYYGQRTGHGEVFPAESGSREESVAAYRHYIEQYEARHSGRPTVNAQESRSDSTRESDRLSFGAAPGQRAAIAHDFKRALGEGFQGAEL